MWFLIAALIVLIPDAAVGARLGRLACRSGDCNSPWLGYPMLALGLFLVLWSLRPSLWRWLDRQDSGEENEPSLLFRIIGIAAGLVFFTFGGQLVGVVRDPGRADPDPEHPCACITTPTNWLTLLAELIRGAEEGGLTSVGLIHVLVTRRRNSAELRQRSSRRPDVRTQSAGRGLPESAR